MSETASRGISGQFEETRMSESRANLPVADGKGREVKPAVETSPALAASVGTNYRDWYEKVLPSPRKTYRNLLLFTIFFLGSFSAWAIVAPIGGATVVPGRLIADGYNQIINHREGGVISKISIREGDFVKAGDVLALIDPAETIANIDIQTVRLNTAEIRMARYRAEQAGEGSFKLPADVQRQVEATPALSSTMESQKTELEARHAEALGTEEIYSQKISSEQQSLSDLEGVLAEREKRMEGVKQEITVSDDLLKQGLTTRDRNFSLKRQLSVDQEQLETLLTQTAERRSRLAQLREDLLRWRAQRKSEISGQIVALSTERAEALERLKYLKGVLERTTIRAPETGHIVRSHVNTVGSSIGAGVPIFELLPEEAATVVEARLTSRDIDVIKVGQEMEVRIASQDRNRSLMFLKGKVTYISYDAIPTGEPPRNLYVIRGTLDSESVEKYGGIRPGTNIDVYLVTEPKNFVHYLLDPFLGIRDKAFTH